MSAPWRSAQARAAWLFVAPALLLIGVFFVVPVVGGLVLSLTDFDLYAIGDPSVARVVGLRNYHQVLTDAEFWNALRNTLYFVLAGGPLSVRSSTIVVICSHSGTLGHGATRSSCCSNARARGSAASAESCHASRRAGRSPVRR